MLYTNHNERRIVVVVGVQQGNSGGRRNGQQRTKKGGFPPLFRWHCGGGFFAGIRRAGGGLGSTRGSFPTAVRGVESRSWWTSGRDRIRVERDTAGLPVIRARRREKGAALVRSVLAGVGRGPGTERALCAF